MNKRDIIYLTEQEFFEHQKKNNPQFQYHKHSKIKHKTLPNVYFYNEYQFSLDLKLGLIAKNIFSKEYLEKMKSDVNKYNKKINPKIVGFFKTINNENIILRSDTAILKNYNNNNEKKAVLIYFNENLEQIVVLKNSVDNLKKFKKTREVLPSNGIRIFKANFLKNKLLNTSLQKIFGMGKIKTQQLLKQKGFLSTYRIKNEDLAIMKTIEKNLRREKTVGLSLKRTIWDQLALLFKSPTYRGTRHRNNLPVRGQRTRTNARTRKKK